MPYIKKDSRFERIDIRTTGPVKKALMRIAKHEHRNMSNVIEHLILTRDEQIKAQKAKFEE